MVDEGYVDIDFNDEHDTDKKNGDSDKIKHG
jgi:hypothetical protein